MKTKKYVLLILFFLISLPHLSSYCQTELYAGDITFIGFNSDAHYAFLSNPTKTKSQGTFINFTKNAWKRNNTLTISEKNILWLAQRGGFSPGEKSV